MALLFTHAFRWWVRARPDHIALVVEDDELTYAELDRWTNGVAHWLIDQRGVRPGDMVAIAGESSMEWCIAGIALLKIGAIIAPANTRYPPNELEYFIRNTSPRFVLTDDEQVPKLRAVPDLGPELNLVSMAAVNDLRDHNPAPVEVEVSATDPAIILYTSGTTGDPKGIVHTNEMIIFAMFEAMLLEGASPDDTSMVLTLPMFTAAGLYHGVTRMMGRGGKLVVMRQFAPRRALELTMRHRVLQFGGTPVVWEQMAKLLPEVEGHDFSHLRFAMVGGGRLSEKLIATYQRYGINVRLAYGLTEAGGTVSFPRLEDVTAHPGTSGDGGVFAEVKAVRRDGGTCNAGEAGELMIRGPFSMRQYWNEPKKTAEVFDGDWLHSGDIGTLDEGGRIRFLDRISNMIQSGGRQISPNGIEAALADIPGVTEIAVVAVPDAELGNKTAAIIYSDTGEIDEAHVRDEAHVKLDQADMPHYVVLSATPLPRLANGKLDRTTLRRSYAGLQHASRGGCARRSASTAA